MLHDTSTTSSELLDLIDALEAEKVAEVDKANPPASFEERPELAPCYDCGEDHLPRRVICCVDGTWMDADGATWLAQPNQNASNIFRVWASIREGIVTDSDGKPWQQIRRYFKGIGANLDRSLSKIIAGITGHGFEIEIYKVYTFCAFNCCPSRDEVWLFGFSRGAYIVRAVAGLMDHLGMLKPEIPDYETEYWESLRVYKSIRNKAEFHQHQYYQHLVQNTRPSPHVRFVGVFDTVKAVKDANLYDISQTPWTHHVRHALALLERRDNFAPSLYGKPKDALTSERSCVEAWFMGGHGNIGGAQDHDGLSLWPLQFILSEAASLGLVLGFQRHGQARIDDPLWYTMPAETEPIEFPFKGGLSINLWDITSKFVEKLVPQVYVTNAPYDTMTDRAMPAFEIASPGYSHIVHPSVYLHDDTDVLGIVYFTKLNFRKQVRAFRDKLDVLWGQLFWNRDFTRELNSTLDKPRILLCGLHGLGKSSLINLMLGVSAATENSGLQSQMHSIDYECHSANSPFVFHDSIGFDIGNDMPFETVQEFINSRRKKASFVDQLHCIWYCLPSDQSRMSSADRDFFERIDFDGIELKIVFTKSDKLRDSSLTDACSLYCSEHPNIPDFDSIDLMDQPDSVRAEVKRLAPHIEAQKKQQIISRAIQFLGIGFQPTCHFVSKKLRDQPAVQALATDSTNALRSEVLRRIHLRAIDLERDRILKKVIPKLVALKSQRPFLASTDLMAKETKIYFYEAQKILAAAFEMEVSHDAFFRNLGEVVEFMLGVASTEKESFLKQVLKSRIAIMLDSGVTSNALLAFLGPTGWAGIALQSIGSIMKAQHDRAVVELDCLCTVLNVYDRMFWFGTPKITRAIAQRAWIEYFKIMADMNRTVEKSVVGVGTDDWQDILTKVTNQYKHKPAMD